MDLAIDLDPDSPTYQDIYFTDENDLVIVEGQEAIFQDVMAAIRVYFGEWFLDTTVGMPFYQVIFVKNADVALVETAFVNQILAVPGVTKINSFSLIQDETNRLPSLSFDISTIEGEIDYSGFLAL